MAVFPVQSLILKRSSKWHQIIMPTQESWVIIIRQVLLILVMLTKRSPGNSSMQACCLRLLYLTSISLQMKVSNHLLIIVRLKPALKSPHSTHAETVILKVKELGAIAEVLDPGEVIIKLGRTKITAIGKTSNDGHLQVQ